MVRVRGLGHTLMLTAVTITLTAREHGLIRCRRNKLRTKMRTEIGTKMGTKVEMETETDTRAEVGLFLV